MKSTNNTKPVKKPIRSTEERDDDFGVFIAQKIMENAKQADKEARKPKK